MYHTAPLLRSPFLRPTCISRKKRGGRNNKDLRCCLAVPPPYLCTEINEELCYAVEEENSSDRHAVAVPKDGGVIDHIT